MTHRSILLVLLACLCTQSAAQRIEKSINDQWTFRFSHQMRQDAVETIQLPHTWNAQDALSGKTDYKRGVGNYERLLNIPATWKGKRVFLRFNGVNSVTNVFINGKFIGEHRGGYGAFVFEITDHVNYGEKNQLLVRVNNGEQLDIMPLVGDFNMYGGIYRDVMLIATEPACITPLDYASPGVYLQQKEVSHSRASVEALVKVSNRGPRRKVEVRMELNDGEKTICQNAKESSLASNAQAKVLLPFTLENPHLWNGRKDPFMYQVTITLWENGQLLDKVVQQLGLRYYSVDSEKGFFLNGEHLTLQGVCRHQDRAELGNALLPSHHAEDVSLMLDMGVNAVRLAHYQQDEEMYDHMDKAGIITWAEIPFVGPGGYADKGFINSPSFRKNGKEQLTELIRQNYNHPSICFWGMFNELKEAGDNPVDFVRELNELSHDEDPSRPTTAASNQGGNLNYITDVIAWNRYDGWYGGMPSALGRFLDKTHKQHPGLCIGISEYGAGASIYHQTDSLVHPRPASFWHPENWQTYYHMENWKIIHERPFVWGSFVWNMFDFGAAHRHEGDRPGINDKGLVTFDRKTKKDAYFFYKANWNKTPMLHLTGKRCVRHHSPKTDIMVFTNGGEVELSVNGISQGTLPPDAYATIIWKDVYLKEGENKIVVRSLSHPSLSDSTTVIRE